MENGNRRKLYLVTLSVSMSMATLGVMSGWVTVMLPKFKNKETNVAMDEYEISTMLAVIPVGYSVGSLATGYIADKFGRRTTILAGALPITLGSINLAFVLKAWQVCITSFSWYCGTGMVSTVIYYYLSEIADKDVRGTLSLITGFMFQLGSLLVMCAGPFLSYKTLNFIILALPVLFFLTCWWIPETPYFYLKNGNVEGARRSLRILRGYKDEEVLEDELLSLQANVKNEMKHSTSVKELFVGVQYRKAIVIATGLKLTQMMTGAAVIKQYLGLIIDATKLPMEKSLVPVTYGVVIFVASMVSSMVVDRVNRRPLLIWSYIGAGASLATVGLYFFLQDIITVSTDTLTTISCIALVGIILASVISTLGFSSLIFIVPSEIFPMNVKAIAMTCLSLLGSALAVFTYYAYQRVKDLCGLMTVFWIFAGFAFGGSAFCYFLVPETKGKDLRDIQVELQGNGYHAVALDDNLEKVVTSNDENKEGTETEELKKKDNL